MAQANDFEQVPGPSLSGQRADCGDRQRIVILRTFLRD
jgi:hypothetical protein